MVAPQEIAELTYQGAKGGLDFIKDDELIADTSYNSIKDRVKTIGEALRKAEEETGHKTMYAFNITDRPSRIKELHDTVVDGGGICVMVNVATLGIEVLRELAEYTEVPIHVHRDFAPAYIRSPFLGMTAQVFTKICRLAGGDQIHIGAIKGKLFERDEEVVASARYCWEEFHHLAPSLPVSSGGNGLENYP
jgi:ribulose-bisphosphate carboxylase large chain